MIETSILEVVIVVLTSVILGMVIGFSINELPSKKVEQYRKKHFKK
jgi:hypothetical protein